MYLTLSGKSKLNTLLVVKGESDRHRRTELINLDGRECSKSIGDFPLTPMYPAKIPVLLNDEIPLVCGLGEETKDCYYLQGYNSTFFEWTILEGGRYRDGPFGVASIVIDSNVDNGKTLWVTGGQGIKIGGFGTLRSTELVSLKGEATSIYQEKRLATFTSQPGPELPVDVSDHCLVKLNSSTAMLIGGRGANQSSYFLEIPVHEKKEEQVKSVRGPKLLVKRREHSCGVLVNPGDGNRQVLVVAGGWNEELYRPVNSTEMLVVGSNQGWTKGPDLPENVQQAAGVISEDGKSFYLVGGRDDHFDDVASIYKLQFDEAFGWQWSKLHQELQVARYNHDAMLIPDIFC